MKTHTFKHGTYRIEECNGLDGCCDVPDDGTRPAMLILAVRSFRAFHSAFHESCHAAGIPDKYVHDAEGYPTTQTQARFLWRWVRDRKP